MRSGWQSEIALRAGTLGHCPFVHVILGLRFKKCWKSIFQFPFISQDQFTCAKMSQKNENLFPTFYPQQTEKDDLRNPTTSLEP